MAEGNGEVIEEMATATKTDGAAETERTADYPKLVEYGLDKRVSFCWYFGFFSFVFVFINIQCVSNVFRLPANLMIFIKLVN